ncbi:splicing factor 3B subunit [Trifolium repens]|jgi:splicing factor 3B subunit 1|nr:splicing factor 3B subunit [Trifolium repens]
MIASLRPDIDNMEENVRSTITKAFSIVAYAIGILALLPHLKTVCQCQESWQTRHTGSKIVHQIAVLFGSSLLPHLGSLVEIIESGLNDENDKVMTILLVLNIFIL